MSDLRVAALSVDLDEIHHYAAIHGLEAGELGGERAIYRSALGRFESLFEELDVPATFFAVAEDAKVGLNGDRLRALVQPGHEVASHTLTHRYDLVRQSRAVMEVEVGESLEVLADATGERPVGFRAPGYTITDELFAVLAEFGLRYDSSVFPCPSYYSAKVAAVGLIGIKSKLGFGQPSASLVDDPRMLSAPADPYRIGTPYWQRGSGMLELPIGLTRDHLGRLPFIGTSVVLAGERGADLLARGVVGRPLVNLELHGIDLADAELDELEPLRPHQPDLRKTVEEKELALRAAIDRLRREGYRFVTLAEAAALFVSRV